MWLSSKTRDECFKVRFLFFTFLFHDVSLLNSERVLVSRSNSKVKTQQQRKTANYRPGVFKISVTCLFLKTPFFDLYFQETESVARPLTVSCDTRRSRTLSRSKAERKLNIFAPELKLAAMTDSPECVAVSGFGATN